jgi:sulfonate transport system permease protein
MISRLLWLGGSAVVTAILIAVWQFIANLKLLPAVFFPGPDVTWRAFVKGMTTGELLPAALTTLGQMLSGWSSAAVLGVLLGGAIASSPMLRVYCVPSLEYFRQIPSSAKLPVAMMILGMNDEMIVVIIAIGAVWPVLLSMIQGFGSIEPRLIDTGRNLQLGKVAMFWKIGLPSALPDIFAGLRISLTISLILAVVAEILTGLGGIGTLLQHSASLYRGSELFAGIMVLSIIGLLCNFALASVSGRLLRR